MTEKIRYKIAEAVDRNLKIVQSSFMRMYDKNAELKGLIKELLLAVPECCWRKCWNCGRKQIHREAVTPGVLCRFCGSQDTRLLKKETQALKGE